jgi:hypothetical protein
MRRIRVLLRPRVLRIGGPRLCILLLRVVLTVRIAMLVAAILLLVLRLLWRGAVWVGIALIPCASAGHRLVVLVVPPGCAAARRRVQRGLSVRREEHVRACGCGQRGARASPRGPHWRGLEHWARHDAARAAAWRGCCVARADSGCQVQEGDEWSSLEEVRAARSPCASVPESRLTPSAAQRGQSTLSPRRAPCVPPRVDSARISAFQNKPKISLV